MKGQCLCGSVTITVPENKNVHACHCGTCVRWNGSPLFSLSYPFKQANIRRSSAYINYY